MYFAQFFTYSIPNQWNGYKSQLIEKCGDRGVIILDGRNNIDTMMDICYETMEERKCYAFQVFKGEAFNRATPITTIKQKTLNAEDIKDLVMAGHTVHWATSNYYVIKDNIGQYLIHSKCNDHYIGLTHMDGVTLNCNDPVEFYVRED